MKTEDDGIPLHHVLDQTKCYNWQVRGKPFYEGIEFWMDLFIQQLTIHNAILSVLQVSYTVIYGSASTMLLSAAAFVFMYMTAWCMLLGLRCTYFEIYYALRTVIARQRDKFGSGDMSGRLDRIMPGRTTWCLAFCSPRSDFFICMKTQRNICVPLMSEACLRYLGIIPRSVAYARSISTVEKFKSFLAGISTIQHAFKIGCEPTMQHMDFVQRALW